MNVAFPVRLVAPLRHKDFRLLWIGQTISALGNPFQTVALSWLVIELTGSALDLAVVLLALTIPQALTTLIGGVLTDRVDARTVMLWSDSVRIFTSGAIALFAFLHWFPLWLLCGILIIHGTANGIFYPAANSIAPRLVPVEMLDSANSLTEMMSQLGVFLGVLPAGLLVAFAGPALAFAVNALSFVVAVLAALLMRPLLREEKLEERSPLQDGIQGLLYLRKAPWLVAILLMDVCAGIAAIGPTTVGLPFLTRAVFHSGPEGYSIFLWSFGCGTVIGTLLPAFYPPQKRRGLLACAIQVVEVPILMIVPFVSFPIAACCLLLLGLLNGYVSILFLTVMQMHVRKTMLGRMMGFFILASFGFIPISYTVTGILAQQAGIQVVFLCAGGLTLVGALLGLSVASLRRLD